MIFIKKYILLIVVFFFLSSCSEKETTTDKKTSASDGIIDKNFIDFEKIVNNEGLFGWDSNVFIHDDTVFYVKSNGIFKLKNNREECILNEKNIGGILTNDKGIYYFSYDKSFIWLIDHNGSNKKKIFDLEKNKEDVAFNEICGFTMYNDKLYIKDTGISCYEYDIEKDILVPFIDDMSSGVFLGDKFYFIEHAERTFSIYAKDLYSGQIELLRGKGETFEKQSENHTQMFDKLLVVEGQLFYTKRHKASIYLFVENGIDILIDDFNNEDKKPNFMILTSDNEFIYYTHEFADSLYCYNPVTKESKTYKISEEFTNISDYIVVEKIVYFMLNNSIKHFKLG